MKLAGNRLRLGAAALLTMAIASERSSRRDRLGGHSERRALGQHPGDSGGKCYGDVH